MQVELTSRAVKQYEQLNEPLLNRITVGIDGLEKEPPEGDIKELKGYPGVFRLRIGRYRILYTVESDCISIFKIAPRGQVYNKRK
jgi:mRNA interferase RelE/StbE